MPETAAPDVQSAPSPEPAIVPESGPAYDKWRTTGELPKSEPAPAQESSAEVEQTEETAPAPEAGKKQEPKPRDNAETRLRGILADIKAAGLTPAELKTFKRESQRQEAAAPAKVEPPKQAKVEPPANDRPTRPKFGDKDGETWEQYETRVDEYHEQLADWKARSAVDNYRKQQAEEAQQREIRSQVDAAKGRYGPEAEATIGRSIDALVGAEIPGAVKAIINDSPVLIDLAYVMGDKPEDLAEFLDLAKSNPGAAIRRVVLMEKLVQEELAKGTSNTSTTEAPERAGDGKFLPRQTKAPERKTTAAPPPPTEVSGRGSAPTDEAAHAAKDGDFETFKSSRNRADMERFKGR